MPYFTGTITPGAGEEVSTLFLQVLLDTIATRNKVENESYVGTGDGTMSTPALNDLTIPESWTVTVTDNTTPGSEIWSVVGSVSGAQASLTTGVAYSNTYFDSEVTAGAVAFEIGDQFTFDITAVMGDKVWTVPFHNVIDLNETNGVRQEIWFHNTGYSGNDNINFGFREYVDQALDRRYYELNFTPYISSVTQYEQDGDMYDLASNRAILSFAPTAATYHIVANENVVTGKIVMGSYDIPLYFGGIINYAPPSASRSISITGATSATGYVDYAYSGTNRQPFWKSYGNVSNPSTYITIDGTHYNLASSYTYVWPIDQGIDVMYYDVRTGMNSEVFSVPITYQLQPDGTTKTRTNIGEADMWKWISGFGIASNTTIDINGETYLACQSIADTGNKDFACFRITGV